MKFRRIYWVTEQLDKDGRSEIAGVYTSIPDLLDGGLRWDDGIPDKTEGFRLTLVKLDSSKKPLGSWASPGFDGLSEDLREYIGTGEFGEMDCIQLVSELQKFGAKKG